MGNYGNLWSYVDKTDTCWFWNGALSTGGYGRIRRAGKLHQAHRYIYELLKGPVPDNKQLDHICHNNDVSCLGGRCIHRTCVNPEHLEIVSNRENSTRGRASQVNAKRMLARTHCKNGHLFSGKQVFRSDGRVERVCEECRREAYARRKAK